MNSVEASAEKSTSVRVIDKSVAEVIRLSLPRRGKFSLRAVLFDLARRLKDIRREIDAETLGAIADEWHRLAGEVVAKVEPATVRAKLKSAFAQCLYGFNDATLASEFAKRKGEPLSETARQFTRDPKVREAVIACEAAARLSGGDKFSLSQRKLGELLGESQQRASEYLATLVEAGVIERVGGYVKGKWPKSYRLVTRLTAVVKSVAEKIHDLLGTVGKLFAGLVGKANAANVPSAPAEPEEPTEPQAESERAWYEADPTQPAYDPNAHKPAAKPSRESDETHKRDGPKPKPKRLRIGRRRTWAEVVFELCKPKPPKQPAQISEPEPI